MDTIVERLLAFTQLVVVGAFTMLWTQLNRLKHHHSQTREQMALKTDLTLVAASLAQMRETTMSRAELDAKLERLFEKLDSTQKQIGTAEDKTSEFRHFVTSQLLAQTGNIHLLATHAKVELIPFPDNKRG